MIKNVNSSPAPEISPNRKLEPANPLILRCTVLRTFAVLTASFLLNSPLAFSDQPAYAAALQQKLSQFTLTRTSKDGFALKRPGTKFVVKKAGMGMERTENGRVSIIGALNDYKNGELRPEFSTLLQHQIEAGNAIAVPVGMKVWVTDVAPKEKEVDLVLVTDFIRTESSPGVPADPDHLVGNRYWGELRFQFPKGEQPNADQIFSLMQEVLQPEDSSPAAYCNALVKLKSIPLSTVVNTAILPNGWPPDIDAEYPNPNYVHIDEPNTEFLHLESFLLRGDHAKEFHATVQSCLPDMTVSQPMTQHDDFYDSHLKGTDPPYDLDLYIATRVDNEGDTHVSISLKRIENEAQRRLDYATVAYLATAVKTCGWTLQTPEQTQNIDRLFNQPTDWFTEEVQSANKHIDAIGRLDFCSDPKEKEKFDRLVPRLWPVGTAGKP
jgi:hypothetical protein